MPCALSLGGARGPQAGRMGAWWRGSECVPQDGRWPLRLGQCAECAPRGRSVSHASLMPQPAPAARCARVSCYCVLLNPRTKR
eukprot:3093674-Prymnesium_polylepis.1